MYELNPYKIWKNDRVGVVFEYNTLTKKYINGLTQIRFNSYSTLKGFCLNNKKDGSSTAEQLERYRLKRVFQRQEQIRDLAYNYDKWEYFVTLTFDDNFMSKEYSHDKAIKLLIRWLDNQKHQNSNMIYLVVPELHKSGRLHFHGLFSQVPKWNLSPAVSPSGRAIYKNGCRIYNLTNYKFGFTTVSEIKSVDKVSFYISKYMTKELLNLRNRKNFWHSKNLEYPKKEYHFANSTTDVLNFISQYEIEHENSIQKDNCSSYYAKYRTSDN